MNITTPEAAYPKVEALVKKYKSLSAAERKEYKEATTRQGFILPLFESLGWDINNTDEVRPEDPAARGWVDFSFRLGNIPRMFLETKRLTEDVNQPKWVNQAIDYAWHKSVTWAILSNFERLRLFNAELKEEGPIRTPFIEFTVDTYLEDFEHLFWLSPTQIEAGVLDREAEKFGKKRRREPVSQYLFTDLKMWRRELFRHLRGYNPKYSPAQIDEAVLRILNRLIFIRTTEDRLVEEVQLSSLVRELERTQRVNDLPRELARIFRKFDTLYNSDLFSPHFSEDLDCEPQPFRLLIEGLYEKRFQLYNFYAIDADILGTVYEQYLGHIIADPEAAEVVEKRAKRKSHGIYYTPTFVVKYIIRRTLTRHLEEHGYDATHPVRLLDTACGSGSFLIEALDVLDSHVARERGQAGGEQEGIRDYKRRMEILTQCVYGVDKDAQAVAVARLNLMLKALHTRNKLPMLNNVRIGNSLISGKPEELKAVFGKTWKELYPFNWEDEFPEVGEDGGFDIIVGNPPYFNVETLGKQSPDVEWIKSHFPDVWMDKSDILFYFIARAIRLLKPAGRMSFIVSRSFIEADKAALLRQFILDYCAIETVIDFRDFRVFQDANIATAIIVLRLEPDSELRKETKIRVAKIQTDEGDGAELMRVIEIKLAEQTEHSDEQLSVFDYAQANLSSKPWAFAPPGRDALFARIDDNHPKLGEVCFVGEGMQTGANEVFEVSEATIRNKHLEKKWLRKRAANSDIGRYLISDEGNWLIWTEDAEKFSDCPEHIAAYLKANSAKLKGRAAYIRGNCEWYKFTWPLHRSRYDQPKIISPYRASENRFALDRDAEYICLTDTTVIFGRDGDKHDLQYYLALLNSSLLTFRYQGIGKMTGSGMYEYFENGVSELPIRQIDFDNPAEKYLHNELVKLADSLLSLEKDRAEAERNHEDSRHTLKRQIGKINSEIDKHVYALYGLREDEIAPKLAIAP